MADTTAFDFTAVSAVPAEMPRNGAGRPRTRGENPFSETLASSYEDFKAGKAECGRSITIPGKNAGEAVYLIRQAADDLGIGSRVIVRNGKGEVVQAKDAKNLRSVTVLFSGKDRKQRKGAETSAEGAGTEAPAES